MQVSQEQSKQVITIHPATRLEGHAKVSIFLDDNGNVKDAYFQTIELRGFEKFCIGRPAEEMPLITPRICGVCPWAHHLASAKATDAVFDAKPPPTARKIRELAYNTFIVHDHVAVFYALSAPDLIFERNPPKETRNILGVVNTFGRDAVAKILQTRRAATDILEEIGGRSLHPTAAIPGGVSAPMTPEKLARIRDKTKSLVELGQNTVDLFVRVVLKKNSATPLRDEPFSAETYYMSLVDDHGHVNFYDGKLKVIDANGSTFQTFDPVNYRENISEAREEWTYMKFPHLKQLGWKGIHEMDAGSIYRVGPLARANIGRGYTTPQAQGAYEEMTKELGSPTHSALGYHWARVIEILHAAERADELAADDSILDPNVRALPARAGGLGIGVTEAPRGTLIHDYETDEHGLLTKVNLIVPTTHNNAGICLSVKKAAAAMIKDWNVNDQILNTVESAFRAYDPCIACGTHALPGTTPIMTEIRRLDGTLWKKLVRD